MILEFSVANFRSIREKQTLSLEASSAQAKIKNTFDINLDSGETVALIKTAGIYGHNSFGKSNLIRALFNFHQLIKNSSDYKIDEKIEFYDPFLFNTFSKNEDTEFEIVFVATNNGEYHKYRYSVSFNAVEITNETLLYYPEKKKHTIFKRSATKEGIIHKAKLGKNFGGKEYELYRNQLLLSKFGKDIPNAFLANVFLYFDTIDIWNVVDSTRISVLRTLIIADLKKNKNVVFLEKLNKLMRIADTKIEELILHSVKETDLPENLPEYLRNKINKSSEQLFARHHVYDINKEISGYYDLPLGEESVGTNYLFALGGLILQKLEKGGVIVLDEIDISLHPLLSRFLIQLCNNPIANPNKAQLIFTSHEVQILDRNNMRADQIWFVDKNQFGETEVYSAQSFDGIREDIPFDKWYLAGKFGAIPRINDSDISIIFDETKTTDSVPVE